MNLEDVIIVIYLKDSGFEGQEDQAEQLHSYQNEFNHSMNAMLSKYTYHLSVGVLEER